MSTRPRTTVTAGSAPCPCGLDSAYANCCRRWHSGAAATTAEQLMRSRFSAYVVRDADYLLATWADSTKPRRLGFDQGLRWTALEVLGHTGGSAFHTEGTVEFRASYIENGVPGELHENSRFIRSTEGRWVYLDALSTG